jgi:2',3'-cyclic-nucleotide 2'-phosphodiesterase
VFMPELDCPFRAVEAEIDACPLQARADAILLDFHAEATSEKQAMGAFLDGRVSCVVGTHTHAPTADERILAGGTAYMTDAGMCGDYQSVVGMDVEEPINRFLTRIPRGRFEPAMGPATLSGLAVETDDRTGLAVKVKAVRLGGALAPTEPTFWGE